RASRLCIVLFCYAVVFLSLGRWMVRSIRRFAKVELAGATFINILLVLACSLTPAIVDALNGRGRISDEYSLLYVVSPLATLSKIQAIGILGLDKLVIAILAVSASAMFLANVRPVIAELRQTRVATPSRVIDDDRALTAKPV